MAEEHDDAARRIIRSLTGGRWTWPPVRVRELYPAPTGKLLLRGRPVRQIVSVKQYADQTDLEYTQFKNGLVELNAGAPRCVSGDVRVDVVYEYGSSPSALILNAIETLAAELVLAETDPGECRLPEQVTSVNRQGISWSVIDPQAFLNQGRIGIYEIDLALAAAGMFKARARVYSPEFPPPERIDIEVLPDPSVTP